MPVDIQKIQNQIDLIACHDRGKVITGLVKIKKLTKQIDKQELERERIQILIDQSLIKVELKRKNLPEIIYPDLPISGLIDDIKSAIHKHQVIIIAGETGSGKSTQLPKICLDMGRGTRGLIGHTQPRRLAARSVANRLAEELDTVVGEKVGFKIRFSDHTNDQTFIKLMTDGILLAEIHHDKYLSQYDTIIIDEAHERSLNIDFLLGYLKQLLPKRPDLKIIITSATIDHKRFSRHFNQAPIIEVSGRTYPVEQRYECYEEYDENITPPEKIFYAVDELMKEGPGDILVFLSTEREIFEAAEFLNKKNLKQTEVLMLFSRLSQVEQNKIFNTQAYRRIILSTNVAETSLTVPGIKYVVDTGFVRISRYNYRTKVQRLPIEAISQASANQRAGRCGRTSPGICIRLYSKEDYDGRPTFTDPEILRTSLASVILQMESLAIGHITDFPFIEPPDHKFIEDGYKLLFELGAVNEKRQVTQLGKNLLKFQIDPKLARMIIEAKHNHCIDELLIITSFLSIQDPRERPTKFQQKSDQAHKANYDKFSDFLSLLNLWKAYQQQIKKLNGNQLKKYCRDKFLAHIRMREWLDIYKQLKASSKFLNYKENSEPATYEQIHKSILSGLLANVGFNYELKEYMGARGLKFYIFPGSSQFKPTPKWIIASELVETTKLYARNVAKIQPEWIEKLATHLVKKNYSNPHWSKKHSNVMAYEKVTLYGLELVPKRLTPYVKIDPILSREIFIRGALVAGDFTTEANFFAANLQLLDEVEDLEHKSRRRDIVVDDETLFNYYDEVVDHNIFNKVTFDQWYKKLNKSEKDKLFFQKSDVMQHDAKAVTQLQFPETLAYQGLHLPLEYHFEPGHKDDGVTIKVPLLVLHQINPLALEWLVPGMIKDKIISLMRALPKPIRKYCVPIPQYADAILDSITYDNKQNLKAMLVAEIIRITGVVFDEHIWDDVVLGQHMQMNIQVIDEKGQVLASNRDLRLLQRQLESKANVKVIPEKKQQNKIYTSWTFTDLAIENQLEQYGIKINVYPCLQCVDQGVILTQETTLEKAEISHRKAVLKLLHLHCVDKFKNLKRIVPNYDKLAMLCLLLYQQASWETDFISSVIIKTFTVPTKRILSQDEYNIMLSSQIENLRQNIMQQSSVVFKILDQYQALKKLLKQKSIPLDLVNLYSSIGRMLDSLVYAGFLTETPTAWLERIPLYIKSLVNRLEKAPRKLIMDREFTFNLESLEQKLKAKIISKHLHILDPDIIHIQWMSKELWISIYAQEIKTQHPVSVVRIEKLISNL